jgi:hypothetical protein
LTPGASKANADFVTVYNFYGLVEGSAGVRPAAVSQCHLLDRTAQWSHAPPNGIVAELHHVAPQYQYMVFDDTIVKHDRWLIWDGSIE